MTDGSDDRRDERRGGTGDPMRPVVVSVCPAPEPAVLAAIVAAVEECWPHPSPAEPSGPITPAWRFSGRWWAKPTAARRERPWAS